MTASSTRQNALAQDLSAKRLEQVTRQKDAELAWQPDRRAGNSTRDAAARRTSLEESVAALLPPAAMPAVPRSRTIRQTRADSQTTIAQKEMEIREATQKRLARQQAETETLARAPHSGRQPRGDEPGDATVWQSARRRPRANTTRPWQSCGMSTCAGQSGRGALCGVRQPGRFAGTGGRPARQDPCAGQRERERH